MTPQNVMEAYWTDPRRVPVWSIRLHEYHGSKVVKHHQCFIRSLSRPKAIDAARRQIKQGSPRKVGPLALFSALYATPEDLGAQPTPATLAAMAMFRYLAWGWRHERLRNRARTQPARCACVARAG